jgi:hypothetical protein
VVDESTGTIYVLSTWNLGEDRESEIIDGVSEDTRRVFVMHSDDDGLSWSEALEITASVKAGELDVVCHRSLSWHPAHHGTSRRQAGDSL